MEKPSKTLIDLCKIGRIHGIYIEQQQTGTDTADTFVKLIGNNGEVKGLWNTYLPFLEVKVSHDSVAEVKRQCWDKMEAWKKFEKQNEKDLDEYYRLKNKFGGI